MYRKRIALNLPLRPHGTAREYYHKRQMAARRSGQELGAMLLAGIMRLTSLTLAALTFNSRAVSRTPRTDILSACRHRNVVEVGWKAILRSDVPADRSDH
jgi:hypothetical protein